MIEQISRLTDPFENEDCIDTLMRFMYPMGGTEWYHGYCGSTLRREANPLTRFKAVETVDGNFGYMERMMLAEGGSDALRPRGDTFIVKSKFHRYLRGVYENTISYYHMPTLAMLLNRFHTSCGGSVDEHVVYEVTKTAREMFPEVYRNFRIHGFNKWHENDFATVNSRHPRMTPDDILGRLETDYECGGGEAFARSYSNLLRSATSHPNDRITRTLARNPILTPGILERLGGRNYRLFSPVGDDIGYSELEDKSERIDLPENNEDVKMAVVQTVELFDNCFHSDIVFTQPQGPTGRVHMERAQHRLITEPMKFNEPQRYHPEVWCDQIGMLWLNMYPSAQAVRVAKDWNEFISVTLYYGNDVSVIFAFDGLMCSLCTNRMITY